MRKIAIAALLAFAPSAALSNDTPLPVPPNYALIEGTKQPVFVNTKTIRSNLISAEKTTSAYIMLFAKADDGADLYVIMDMVAWCQSGKLMRMKANYVSANEKLLGTDEKSQTVEVTEDSSSKAIFQRLCSDWDQYD
ncbi:MAG: hypothetical protein ABJP70_05745 [Erythrobacter sp.]